MQLTHLVLALIVVPAAFSTMAPTASAHLAGCDLLVPTTVTTGTTTFSVPLPGSVGPAGVPAQTVGGQTVGGQTVGGQAIPSHTVPMIVSVGGVPVVGTLTVGGQTVGGGNVPAFNVPTHTLPQETVGPVTVGPVPTGLQPISVTVYGQTVDVPVSSSCASTMAFDQISHTGGTVLCISLDAMDDLMDLYIWTAFDCAANEFLW